MRQFMTTVTMTAARFETELVSTLNLTVHEIRVQLGKLMPAALSSTPLDCFEKLCQEMKVPTRLVRQGKKCVFGS